MIKLKNCNSAQGFFSLIALVITLAIMIFLIVGVYFSFNKWGKNSPSDHQDQSSEPAQSTPKELIDKAEGAKDLIESQNPLKDSIGE